MDDRAIILVVERHDSIGELLIEVLHDEGYSVTRVVNGAQTIAALERALPALLLLDVHSVDLRSAPVLAALQALARTDVAILLMGTNGHDRVRIPIATGLTFLEKPFHLTTLLDRVASAVPCYHH